MIDNFSVIDIFLNFRSEDDFYFIQVIKRKKDNPNLEKNSKLIDTYIVDNHAQFRKIKERIISQCHGNNARAYINLNRRSYEKVALETLKHNATLIAEGNYKALRKSYYTACGTTSNEKDYKKWIVDVDIKDRQYKSGAIRFINSIDPKDISKKILIEIETKNGYHLITRPFDKKQFKDKYPDIEIHTNNPTILFIP